MAEQIYTIPVNEAFESDCECPICKMHKELEDNALEYTLGPSYMEYDIRDKTNELGFCPKHSRMLYEHQNRLGLALMLKTHTDKTIKDMKKLAAKGYVSKKALFGKGTCDAPIVDYVKKLESTCFVCDKINSMFNRYINTIFYMWKKDPAFIEKFKNCKGFCTTHYALLYEQGANSLSAKQYKEFITILNDVYFSNMERLNADLAWFIEKFDYRNQDADWKTSKDSLQRALIKTAQTFVD